MRMQINVPSMPTSRVEQGQDNQRAQSTNPQTASATRSVRFHSRVDQTDLQRNPRNQFLHSHPEAQRCKIDNHAVHRSGVRAFPDG